MIGGLMIQVKVNIVTRRVGDHKTQAYCNIKFKVLCMKYGMYV